MLDCELNCLRGWTKRLNDWRYGRRYGRYLELVNGLCVRPLVTGGQRLFRTEERDGQRWPGMARDHGDGIIEPVMLSHEKILL